MVRNIPEPIRRARKDPRPPAKPNPVHLVQVDQIVAHALMRTVLQLSLLCLHGRRRPVLRPIQNLIRQLLRVIHIV
jgi:hypothetical protein